MESNNSLMIVAVFAVALSFIGAFMAYNSFSNYNGMLTGFAIEEEGVVNVTISSLSSIEIYSAGGTPDSKVIDWGTGRVAPGPGNFAILSTNGTVTGADGSAPWSAVNGGFLVRNIGNTKVSLSIHATPTAADFIGGSSPSFQYNLSNLEASSCSSWETGIENVYTEFGSTPSSVCTSYGFAEDADELTLDILLKIPSDSKTGQRSSVVTLTYDAVAP